MKTFRQIVSEVAEPKAGDEKAFKAKHIVTKVDYPVDVEDQFTGGKTVKKTPKRIADHEAGEDEKVYEAIDPVNKKAAMGKFKHRADKDIDNDGDVDSSDKYLHARRKAITKAVHSEEVELDLSDFSVEEWEEFMESAEYDQLDEISKKTLGSYVKKASSDMANNAYKLGARDPLKTPGSWDKAFKRKAGIAKATDKMTKEEVEGLDEISIELAKKVAKKRDEKGDAFRNKAGIVSGDASKGAMDRARKNWNKADKTKAMIAKRQANEEAEQIDELKKSTLASYIKKASGNMAGNAAVGAAQASSSMKKMAPDVKRDIFKRAKGIARASDKLANESVEQLDELSPNTLHSYIKGASVDMKKHASMAGYDSRSRAYNNATKNAKRANKRLAGIASASGRLADKANMAENAWEEVPMMMRQLQFISYAAEEIMEYLDMAVDPDEWYQNKLAHIHDQMQTLHAYAEGEKRMMSKMDYRMYGEAVEKETIKHPVGKRPHGIGWTLKSAGEQTGKDHSVWERKVKRVGGMKKEEVELDEVTDQERLSARKIQRDAQTARHGIARKPGESMVAYLTRAKKHKEKMQKEEVELDEVTQSAVKKPVTTTGPDGKTRTVYRSIKTVDRDEHGQEKMKANESVELDEAFKVGMVKLNDGSSVILKKEDVDVLNNLFKNLSSTNRKKMESTAMKNKNGFDEILSFAKEATQ